MSMNPQHLHIALQPATHKDVQTLARISVDAMSADRHTQLKCLGDVPYTTIDGAVSNLLNALENPKCVHVKAVDENAEKVVGYGSFWFHGFPLDDIPYTDPRQGEGWQEVLRGLQEESKGEMSGVQGHARNDERAKSLIEALDDWESADMDRWQKVLMPQGSKCIIIHGLHVASAARGKGIGGAIVQWATDEADKRGVYMWVHSSEGAFRVYERKGFDVVGTLDVDMDAWAPAPPAEGGIWGRYVIRYMKRLPRATGA